MELDAPCLVGEKSTEIGSDNRGRCNNRGKQFNILTQLWTHNLSAIHTSGCHPCGDDDDIVM